MTSTAMTPIFVNPVNPQGECLLFNKIPQEIRDEIFDLVVTPHDRKHVPYPEGLRYCRPGFRHADRNLSTTLLRCCQLIYFETCDLPAKKYVQVDWVCGGKNSDGFHDDNLSKRSFPKTLQNLHLFTTTIWLERWKFWEPYTRLVATQAPDLRYLKIILEHNNLLYFAEYDLVPNPKQERFVLSCLKDMKDSDPFEERSWGNQLRALDNLNIMDLEIETLEENKEELNLVISKAAGWRFPLENGKELVFNPRKTRWEGWHGPNLGGFCPSNFPLICMISTF